MCACKTWSELDDAELVLAAQRGERGAVGELAGRYERTVYAIALRKLGNHAEAQEVCQEVFMRVLQKIGQLRQPECFAGWLRSVTVRTAINRAVRSDPGHSTEPEILANTCSGGETPVAAALAKERATQIRAGLRRLGELDRSTLEAFYMNGRSLTEMSDEFASPVGTIKRRLHVARKRLARELGELAAV